MATVLVVHGVITFVCVEGRFRGVSEVVGVLMSDGGSGDGVAVASMMMFY